MIIKMKIQLLFIISLIALSCTQISSKIKDSKTENDDFYEKSRKLVLSENQVGKEYVFKINGNDIDEINIKFIGISITKTGDTLKVINSTNYTGVFEDARKANSSIYLYNQKNELLGFYHVGSNYSLPKEVKDSELVFQYDNELCNQTTKISLRDSIPDKIFILCKGQSGDFYQFEH